MQRQGGCGGDNGKAPCEPKTFNLANPNGVYINIKACDFHLLNSYKLGNVGFIISSVLELWSFFSPLQKEFSSGVAAHAYNLNSWEGEAGRSRVCGHPRLQEEFRQDDNMKLS